MKTQELIGIALEDNCALVIKNKEFKILKSDINSKAYKLYNINGEVKKEVIENNYFTSLDELKENKVTI